MILTEEEAKTKWCPEARASNNGEQPIAINRVNRGPDVDCLCIASACMAWRWQSALTVNNPNRTPGAGQTVTRERGYCGKAGRP